MQRIKSQLNLTYNAVNRRCSDEHSFNALVLVDISYKHQKVIAQMTFITSD